MNKEQTEKIKDETVHIDERILCVLDNQTLSVAKISKEVNASKNRVGVHIRKLRKWKIIKHTPNKEVNRRGAKGFLYYKNNES